jgi:LasA protease
VPQRPITHSVPRSKWIAAVIVLAALVVTGVQPSSSVDASSGDGSALLSLPWTQGEVWRLTGGPHSDTGAKAHPWSALDFQPLDAKAGGKVRAARGGIVSRPCANMVVVHHADGWVTSYYHLRNIPVQAGDWVDRGQLLGYTSTQSGCGGYATGPHVHFALMHNKEWVNISGNVIGGWTVHEGDSQYEGCLVKGGVRRCAFSGQVYNSGSVGAR